MVTHAKKLEILDFFIKRERMLSTLTTDVISEDHAINAQALTEVLNEINNTRG